MSRLFGTDGVRACANSESMGALSSLQLAQAAAVVLGFDRVPDGERPKAVIAHDSRISGEFIGAAISAGLASSGVDVYDAGMLPTPAAAYLVADLRADFGVMISASHNPFQDNGIKFLARGGKKLPDAVEDRIEAVYTAQDFRKPRGADLGRISRFADAEDRYVTHLISTMQARSALEGLTIVLDCAHGAASGCSPDAFRMAGARVHVLAADPNGTNINDGVGSTHLEGLQAKVREVGADLGIAHDGDADRCLAVDERGEIVDGDTIMSILAVARRDAGQLKDNTQVATVMTHQGMEKYLESEGIHLVRTKVGDRYVLEAMNAEGYTLGGEQSGHVIMSDYATTGDGILTGLHLAAEVNRTGLSLSTLATRFERVPQTMINVSNVDKNGVETNAAVQTEIASVRSELGEDGRVLLRSSGTEPLVRVMVEGPSESIVETHAQRLAAVVAQELGLKTPVS